MSRSGERVTLGEARDTLRRDLPGQARNWLLVGAGIALLLGLTGRYSWTDAVVIGVSFLPFAIPVGPLLWLNPLGPGADLLHRPGGFRLFGLFALWGVATFLPAAVLAFGVLRLGGLR